MTPGPSAGPSQENASPEANASPEPAVRTQRSCRDHHDGADPLGLPLHGRLHAGPLGDQLGSIASGSTTPSS